MSGVSAGEASHQYQFGEEVTLWYDYIGPYRNPSESYSFESLPWCSIGGYSTKSLTLLDSLLFGHKLIDSGLPILFGKSVSTQNICNTTLLTLNQKNRFINAIRHDYINRMYIDGLSIFSKIGEFTKVNDDKAAAAAVVVVEPNDNAKDDNPTLEYYLFTHKKLVISHNNDKIVGVTLIPQKPVTLHVGQNLTFSYSVQWYSTVESFDDRNRIYELDPSSETKLISLINSFIVLTVLTFPLISIFMKTLRNNNNNGTNNNNNNNNSNNSNGSSGSGNRGISNKIGYQSKTSSNNNIKKDRDSEYEDSTTTDEYFDNSDNSSNNNNNSNNNNQDYITKATSTSSLTSLSSQDDLDIDDIDIKQQQQQHSNSNSNNDITLNIDSYNNRDENYNINSCKEEKFKLKETIGELCTDIFGRDSSNWKLIQSDVNRAPHRMLLFSSMVGVGFHLFCMFAILYLGVLLGLRSGDRGSGLGHHNIFNVLFILFPVTSGLGASLDCKADCTVGSKEPTPLDSIYRYTSVCRCSPVYRADPVVALQLQTLQPIHSVHAH
ncbi:hypothetical protein PPL_02896 [Heterostelium album PN500]|uniref:Transmembrane 9 superfamily member n=1 Tax=Heterostelium pallidum (strain ATCC 26659 / Pp 5 / PN500) TaxID=670386 RepID=D3B3D0_HETP5|nr:hypothetical protein PPL_02896 [Heterostelium album PN500]EFA83828.1 hypothetical protein PPL_02896 [Heterostelium album PN500]|eukprot:XP_020435945.1 hypothetical protein PPL_02896 [Heterostelium album PN500]